MSPFTASINLLFGLPLFLLPGRSLSSILLPTYSLSLLKCPNHLSLASLALSHNLVYVCCSYDVIIPNFIHPRHSKRKSQRLQFHSFQLCIFVFSKKVSGTVNIPYSLAGLATVLLIFPFFLQKPCCHISLQLSSSIYSISLKLSSLPPYHTPLPCTVNPKHQNLPTLPSLHLLACCLPITSVETRTQALIILFFPRNCEALHRIWLTESSLQEVPCTVGDKSNHPPSFTPCVMQVPFTLG